MAAQKGSYVVLKMGDGADVGEEFTVIAGLRENGFRLNNRVIDASNMVTGKWRSLIAQGVSDVNIEGEGVFLDSAMEQQLREKAFTHEVWNYCLQFGNGDRLTAAFVVAEYERLGEMAGEEVYQLRLESAGDVIYQEGA